MEDHSITGSIPGTGAARRAARTRAAALQVALIVAALAALAPRDVTGVAAQAGSAIQPARRAEPLALPSPDEAAALRTYIERTWEVLTRTLDDLPAAAEDPKYPRPAGEPWPVYVAPTENLAQVSAHVASTLDEADRRRLVVRVLPDRPLDMEDHGLLYLPEPYVVPGGRFNEMYGWDSYFIVRGLLAAGHVERARQMTDNHLYQVEHYGMVLNANRTYYLSRSQPPFLATQVLAVFERTRDRGWLERAVGLVDRYYGVWAQAPHLAGTTGLARYYDRGEGPAPEVVASERDARGRTHYDRVAEHFAQAGESIDGFPTALFYDRRARRLTPFFYKGDRSMRESGFDPSNRFGPFGAAITRFAPVCLNSLLYRYERDRAALARHLERDGEARLWERRAETRRLEVDRRLWDEARGIYLDFDVEAGERRDYLFATTFFPLWTGLATPAQARRVRAALEQLEAPGGLLTSTTVSGSQWDAPFGWAPLQLAAVEGLRRYGFEEDAARLAARFVGLVSKELGEHGVIVEKYDVRRRESDVGSGIRFGYDTNEVGFGWTNAAVLEMLALLDARQREAVGAAQGEGSASR